HTNNPKEGIEALAETIRQIGIINPIQVRYVEPNDLFEIIPEGKAIPCRPISQLKSIPCIVREPGDDERRATKS
ncbi:MAG: ParB N-terminal domain-containing protein, partial [Candidatus Latescibacteria bacterium]|nr:ParB N-terminal domain-containing protein [Candidatus Latescibacterota bacterium]